MSIKEALIKIIKDKKAIEIDKFMEIVLSSQKDSYYRSKNPIGENSDFITAPEVSQMFGEMIGLWAIDAWNKLGKPNRINIVEFGAGRGTLLRDFLKVARMDRGFYNSLSLYIIDISEELIKVQKDTLKEHNNIKWVKSLGEVEDKCTLFLANEFFDALPIKQYTKKEGKIFERIITQEGEGLSFSVKEASDKNMDLYKNFSDDSIFEESLLSKKYMEDISKFLFKNKGGALIIDYGYDIEPELREKNQYQETLQAIRNHKYSSILEDLGNSDLTAHVDFNALKNIAKKNNIESIEIVTQGNFLLSQGIDIRMENLKKQNPNLSHILAKQYSRLVSPNEMGNIFKTMILMSL